MAKKQNKKVAAEKVVAEVVSVPVAIPEFGREVPNKVGQLTDPIPDVHLVLAVDRLNKITRDIVARVSTVAQCFLSIGDKLRGVRDDPSLLKDCGYEDVYDYSSKEFGFGRTSTKNLIEVSAKFGDKGSLLPKYQGFSFTQLVELLPVDSDIDSYKPSMTVKEIRNRKVVAKASADRAQFMDFFRKSLSASLLDVGFTEVSLFELRDGDDRWYSYRGLFQLSASFRRGAYKCRGLFAFEGGKFSFYDPMFGSTCAGDHLTDYKSVDVLAKAVSKMFFPLADAKAKAAVYGVSKKGRHDDDDDDDDDGGDDPSPARESKELLWLKMTPEQKKAALSPSAVSNYLYDKAPFFIDPYLHVDNVGLCLVSPTSCSNLVSPFLVLGRFVPDAKEPIKVVCVWLCFCFLSEDGRVEFREVMDDFDMNVSGVCDRLDAIAAEAAGVVSAKEGA